MMDSPKKLSSNGSMHFSYNLQEERSPKNLSKLNTEASKNLNYRADKQNYITGISDDAFGYPQMQIKEYFASIS